MTRQEVFCIGNNEINLKYEKSYKLLQFIAAVTASLCVMASGATISWTSPIMLMLQENPANEDNPLGRPIGEEEASWIASLPTVGTLFSCFFTGYLADRWGRRTILLFSTIPFAISWLLIGVGKSIGIWYVARFISGLANAIGLGIVSIYCAEIAEPSIRGVLGSFFEIFITTGLLWAFCIGPNVSFINYCIACAALPIAFFVLFYLMPESPYYLAAKGRKEDVIRVLVRLRGKSRKAVETEANEIEKAVREISSKKTTIMDLFRVKANFKALILTCTLITFQQLSGIIVVLLYSELIFASAGKISISSANQTIIVGLVQVISTCFNPLVVDRMGRRILLIISSAGAALSLGILGLFFYLKDVSEIDVSNVGWLPIFSLVAYMISYSVGLGPLSWTVMGEMFSQEIKSKASGIFVFMCCFSTFIMGKYFISIADAYGNYTAFWIFGGFCILCLLFTAFFLPETKGKSLQQIQDELRGENTNNCKT